MTSSSSGRRGLSFSIGGLSPHVSRPRVSSGERPLVVLVAADTSGRAANRLREPLAGRSSRQVDVDRLDGVVRSWNARVPVQIAGETLWLEPRALDELHPDHLLEDVPQLATLLALRGALGHDPQAAAELARLLPGAPSARESHGGGAPASDAPASDAPASDAPASGAPASAGAASAPAAAAAESSQDTLARLLGGAQPARDGAAQPARDGAAQPARAGLDIDRFIRAIVGAAPAAAPPIPDVALEAAADAEVGRRLRALLAAPAFRELEAAWRGIDGLCRNCPDEELVKTHVLDVSLEELAADPLGLSRLLASESPDVFLVDHRFGASVADLNILLHLLEVCHAANVELAAGARPELAGCAHFAEVERPEDNVHEWTDDVRAAWASLRALRERGARLELALPRFVLRQPYGAAGEPLERLRFEEVEDQKDHEAFCWGNGAYLLVRALTIQHAEASRVRADGGVDVRELPIVHIENTEQVTIKPPAESWLSERSVGKLRAAGFAVLEGVRGTDRVIVHPAG